MPSVLFEPRPQLIDTNGEPIVNGYWYFSDAGTSNPKDTYDDYALTTPNPNPVRTAIDGRPKDNVNIFLSGAYKVDARDADDASLPGYPVDNVISYSDHDFTGLTASIADLNSTTTTALIKSSDYAPTITDRGKTILANAASTSIDITLLPAIDAGNTYKIIIKKFDVSTNVVNVNTNAAETIDARTSYILYDYNDFVEVHCDGSNWKVVASQIRGTIRTVAANTTLVLADNNSTFNIDAAGGALSMNLPVSATVGKGYQVSFKRIDSSLNNSVTINGAGAETIDGESQLKLINQFEFYSIKTDGFVWFITAEANEVSGFKTGDVKLTFIDSSVDFGWVIMDDGTIGSFASGASTRNDADTKDLFILLWDNVSDTWAPVVGGRGSSGLADFNADKKLTLPRSLGRAMCHDGAGAGLTPRSRGEYLGEETHPLTVAELAAHTHTRPSEGEIAGTGFDTWNVNTGTSGTFYPVTGITGSGTPHNNMQPSAFMGVHIKL